MHGDSRVHVGKALLGLFGVCLLSASVCLQAWILSGALSPVLLAWGIGVALGVGRLFTVFRQRVLRTAQPSPALGVRMTLNGLRGGLFLLSCLLVSAAVSRFGVVSPPSLAGWQDLSHALRDLTGWQVTPARGVWVLSLLLAVLLETTLCLVLGALADMSVPVWLALYRHALDTRLQAITLRNTADREMARFEQRIKHIQNRARETTEAAEAAFREHRHKLATEHDQAQAG